MFYFKEIIFRLCYIFLSFCLIFIVTYFYRHDLLSFFLLMIFRAYTFENILDIQTYITITSPVELFDIYIHLSYIFSFYVLIPIFFFQILDYSVTMLSEDIYLKFKKFLCSMLIMFYSYTLICFLFIFPDCWLFFEAYNISTFNSTFINLQYEPRLIYVINFLLDFCFYINLIYCLFIMFIIFISSRNLSFLIKNKWNIYLLFSILSFIFMDGYSITHFLFINIILYIILEFFQYYFAIYFYLKIYEFKKIKTIY